MVHEWTSTSDRNQIMNEMPRKGHDTQHPSQDDTWKELLHVFLFPETINLQGIVIWLILDVSFMSGLH